VPPFVSASRVDPIPAIIDRHQAAVWRHLRWLGCNASEADDLTQEVFLVLLERPFEARSPAETASFLRATAVNLWKGHRKARRAAGRRDAEDAWAQAATDAFLAGERGRSERLEALIRCVARLDGRARSALDAHYRERLPRDEVARRLRLKPGGVKILLQRTRKALRLCVERSLEAQS